MASSPTNNIPFNFIQTYKDNHIHGQIRQNTKEILQQNPGFSYRLITDLETEKLIVKYFSDRELKAFRALKNGSARGDFARYVAMYVYGGVYMDLDCSFEGRFVDNMNFARDFVFMIDHGTTLIQCFFAAKPKNPLLKLVVDACCEQIEQRVPRIGKATGPSIFTHVIYCATLGENVERNNLPLINGVLQIQNEQYQSGSIIKLYTINQINNKHYRKFRYRFKGYEDDMMYARPEEKYNLHGPTRNLYHSV